MPKINEVISNLKLTPLQRKVLAYLQNHNDEVFQYKDLNELAKSIKHNSLRGIASSLWTLSSKGMISKARIGRKIYYGSKEAIDYLLTGLNKERTDKKHDPYILQFINRLPQALADVLEVIFIMRHDEVSRIKATAYVAEIRGVTAQTIIDKYTRQLRSDLSASEVDSLLGDYDYKEFKVLLINKYPEYKGQIEIFFQALNS